LSADYNCRQAKSATFVTFMLFVGVAVSITAFPVLARILTNQDLSRSKVGVIALSSAAIDDVVYESPSHPPLFQWSSP